MSRALALFGGEPIVANREHRSWPVVGEVERANVMRVLDRGVLSGAFSPEATAFEAELARFVGAKHALLTHCGTSALQLALAAAGVGPGDEVVVPAYSFVATPLSVALEGAVPVFADVDLETGCLDPRAAAAAISPRTRAIMPVHMHGGAADLGALLELAKSRNVALVEDAAQAHGATFAGKPVGALGLAGGFSMQSSKNLSAGEGGVFVTNDDAAAELAHRVRNFGQDVPLLGASGYDPARPLDGTRALVSTRMGSMYRGNEMMAAFARAQLERLPELTRACQRNAERLSRALGELPGVLPPKTPEGRTSVFHKYRVRFDPERAGVSISARALRDVMIEALRAEGLEVVMWQNAPLPAQPVFQASAKRWALEGGVELAANYEPSRYGNTQKILDGSVVLFSQTCPLIAQSSELVDRYAEAFARVWAERRTLEARAREAG